MSETEKMTANGVEVEQVDSAEDADSEESEESKLPDGGYGWVVVLAVSLMLALIDGLTYNVGVLYAELLHTFKDRKSKTALVGSLLSSVSPIFSPVGSIVVNQIGCRWTGIIGGAITGLGLSINYFGNSIDVLCFTMGVIPSIGMSLCDMAGAVILTHYFDKKLGIANGITVAASGIGTFIIAPSLEFLFNEYGWRGAVLISGAIMLHLIVFSALLISGPGDARNAQPPQEPQTAEEEDDEDIAPSEEIMEAPSTLPLKRKFSYYNLDPAQMYSCDALKPMELETATAHLQLLARTGGKYKQAKLADTTKAEVRRGLNDVQFRPIQKKDFMGSHNNLRLVHRKLISQSITLRKVKDGRNVSVGDNRDTLKEEEEQEQREEEEEEEEEKAGRCPSLRNVVDLGVLTNIPLMYYLASQALFYLCLEIPYMFSTDKAIDMGISSEKASFLVSIMGIVLALGQFVIGWLGDHEKLDTVQLMNVHCTFAGAATILIPFMSNYVGLAIMCGLFSYFASATYTLTSLIILDQVGMEKFALAYGMVSFAQGVFSMCGPPFAGFIAEVTGTYDYAFYVMGSGMVISGLMLSAMPIMYKLEAWRTKSLNLEDDAERGSQA